MKRVSSREPETLDSVEEEFSTESRVATGVDFSDASGSGPRDAATMHRTSSDLSDDHPLLGTVVADRYLVQELIGQGGMGAVYRAEHVHMKKPVALKVLHPSMSMNPEVVARFEREAVAAGRLQHPGVVAATDFGRLSDGAFYLALELVDGLSLADVLAQSGPLGAERALGIAFQITSALSVAHQEGIVHRDLKPDNVMLVRTDDNDDFVKVLDFGIAKVAMDGDGEGLTRAGLVFGTPEYMSPEQAMGHEADARSDVYGVGMMLYEMVAGHSPFKASEVTAMLTAQITQPPPELPAAVPEPLARLIYRLLEKNPEQRPANASELGEELIELIDQLAYKQPVPRTSAGTKLDVRRSSVDKRELRGGSAPGVLHVSRGQAGALRSVQTFSMRPLSIGHRQIPLWVPVMALLTGAVIGAVAMLSNEDVVAPIKQAAAVQAAEPVDVEAQLLSDARSGNRDAVAELRKQTTAKQQFIDREGEAVAEDEVVKQVTRYMALGRGYSAIKHGEAAVDMYREAVKLDPHSAEDADLLLDVRAALDAQDAVEAGLDFANEYLGAPGADLIYDVYLDNLGQVGMTPVVARAMRLVNGDQILEHATPALQVALRLNRAKVCAEYREIISDAAEYSDDRSLLKLRALTTRRGCGTYGNKDCFVCLRNEDIPLDKAVERAETHPSPTFLREEAGNSGASKEAL